MTLAPVTFRPLLGHHLRLAEDLAPFIGEFRFVFYASPGYHEDTVDFYNRVLELPVVGGFPGGTCFQSGTGVIEVIDGGNQDDELRPEFLGEGEHYRPPRGGFLLIEVPDVDACAQLLRGRGATLLQEVRDWPWRFRDLKLADPCGNVICLFFRLRGWEPFHGEPP